MPPHTRGGSQPPGFLKLSSQVGAGELGRKLYSRRPTLRAAQGSRAPAGSASGRAWSLSSWSSWSSDSSTLMLPKTWGGGGFGGVPVLKARSRGCRRLKLAKAGTKRATTNQFLGPQLLVVTPQVRAQPGDQVRLHSTMYQEGRVLAVEQRKPGGGGGAPLPHTSKGHS